MPSISHRTGLSHEALCRAKSGLAALPAGFVRRTVRWCAERFEDWRALRQLRDLDEHLLRDIGLTAADARRSTIFSRRGDRDAQDPKGPPTWPTTS